MIVIHLLSILFPGGRVSVIDVASRVFRGLTEDIPNTRMRLGFRYLKGGSPRSFGASCSVVRTVDSWFNGFDHS